MALIVADRVLETTTTTGTGALTLAAAITGYQRFSAVCATNDTAYYHIQAVDVNGNPSGDWEAGLGTYSSSNTLTRTTVQASSNANAAVNFAAGTKHVALGATATYMKFILGRATVTILVTDPNGLAISTGDGKAYYRVPSTLNGMNLVGIAGAITTTSSSGIPTFQLANVTDAVDMLSTKLTIDAGELDSKDATPAVIDTSKDDVATGDMLRIDCDVSGTGAKGLIVELQFQLP